jgi:hypothetical protein
VNDTLANLTAAFHSWPAHQQAAVVALMQSYTAGKITRDQLAGDLDSLRLPGVRSVRPRPVS